MSNRNANRNSQSPQNQPPVQQEKTPAQLKREELESLSDAELDERWKIVFATETGPEMEREKVIDQIMANSPTPIAAAIEPEVKKDEKGKFVTDSKGRQHFIPHNAKNKVVVVQDNLDVFNGEMIVVPNTMNLQFYSKNAWDRLNREDSKGNTFFTESKIKTEVLQGA